MNNVVICDLDGTFFNVDHRKNDVGYPVQKHNLILKDVAYLPVREVILKFITSPTHEVVFLTGRDEAMREASMITLKENLPNKNWRLIMKDNGDETPDNIWKLDVVRKEFNKDEILCIFEDRPRVVQSFRDAGYYVFDCNQESDGW